MNGADTIPGPLTGLRILELADESGQFCGKLLRDLAMEVVKDEKGGLTSKLKEVTIKDWQDPLHGQCLMKE